MVLKSDYGREGTEVIVGKDTAQGDWSRVLRGAVPSRWIIQAHFEAERGDQGEMTNYGVFVIAGRATGIYLRASSGPTDAFGQIVPILERGPLHHPRRPITPTETIAHRLPRSCSMPTPPPERGVPL